MLQKVSLLLTTDWEIFSAVFRVYRLFLETPSSLPIPAKEKKSLQNQNVCRAMQLGGGGGYVHKLVSEKSITFIK